MRRAMTLLAATMLAVGGVAAPSVAKTLPVCGTEGAGSGNIPGQSCQAAVEATPECEEGVVVLDYVVRPGGTTGSTVDITFTGLPGGDVLVAGQPLSGSVPFPAGETSAAVVFGTNPAVRIPAAANPCRESAVLAAADRSSSNRGGVSGVLAATGVEASTLATGAGALVLGGLSLVLLRRRRHGASEQG